MLVFSNVKVFQIPFMSKLIDGSNDFKKFSYKTKLIKNFAKYDCPTLSYELLLNLILHINFIMYHKAYCKREFRIVLFARMLYTRVFANVSTSV